MEHKENCMCDSCINKRVIEKREKDAKLVAAKKFEEESQAYIRRRGGVDPRGA